MRYMVFLLITVFGTIDAANSVLERQLTQLKASLNALHYELESVAYPIPIPPEEFLNGEGDSILNYLLQLKAHLTTLQRNLILQPQVPIAIRKPKEAEPTVKAEVTEPVGIIFEEPEELIIEEPIAIRKPKEAEPTVKAEVTEPVGIISQEPEELIIEEPIILRKAKETEEPTPKVLAGELVPISLEEPEEPAEIPIIRLSTVSYNDINELFERIRKEFPFAILDDEKPIIQLRKDLGFKNDELRSYYQAGYIFLFSSEFMRGKVVLANKDDVKSAFQQLFKKGEKSVEEKQQLAAQYKIHLMPKNGDDLLLIIENFLKELKTNPQLQDAIKEIKFMPIDFSGTTEDIKKRLTRGEEVMPIIVIYPADGKDKAQFVLDMMYQLFDDMEGLDVTPRYNKKVTSLIYYAQSHGDFKFGNYERYFTDDKIFFRPDFEGEDLTIDYSLKNPEFLDNN